MNPESVSGASVFLDPQVLSSIVVGVFSVLTAFFGWLATRNKRSERKKLRQEQLGSFYEPLDCLISFKSSVTPENTLADIVSLMSAHYRHATPGIQQEIRKLCEKKTVKVEDFSDLQKMVSSVYNWLRRTLGYPYDKKQINKAYLPRNIARIYYLREFFIEMALSFSVLLCSVAIGLVIPKKVFDMIVNILLLFFLGCFFYIVYWILKRVPKKK